MESFVKFGPFLAEILAKLNSKKSCFSADVSILPIKFQVLKPISKDLP